VAIADNQFSLLRDYVAQCQSSDVEETQHHFCVVLARARLCRVGVKL